MDKLGQRNFELLLQNIKNKKYLELILKDEELKKEALEILNVKSSMNSGNLEINISEIVLNKKYEKELQKIVVENPVYKNQFMKHYEQELKTNYEVNYKQVAEKIREMNENVIYLKNDLERLIITKNKLSQDINKLQDEKQEIEILIKENKDIDKFIKEKREKRHIINLEITKLEEEKNKLNFEMKNLKEQKDESEKSVRILITDNEDRKKTIIESYELKIKEKKDFLDKNIENLNNERSLIIKNIEELSFEKNELVESLEKLKEDKKALIGLEKKLEFSRLELIAEQNEVNSFKSNISEYIKKVEEKVKITYENRVEDLEEMFEDANQKISQQFKDIQRLQNLNNTSVSIEEIKINLEEEKSKNRALSEKVEGINEVRVNKIRELEEKIDKLKEVYGNVVRENAELSNENLELIRFKDKIEGFERTLPELERSKEHMIALIEKQRNEIILLENKSQSRAEKEKSIEQIYFEIEDSQEFMPEKEWLNKTKKTVEKVGFEFSNRLLYAFHTSLKIADWSSLSVLAGVSGTGKSELPRLYSRYGGINFLPLAVQPNWDSPHSLFGFYNSLEQKFNPTTLLKVLYQAQKSAQNSINEYLTIVLLDEMNLAHVELYFSELLSKLELMRGKENGVDLEIDLGDKEPYKINLNNSIMWVGTMNEDETTKSLSDKVIDRGNLINFPKPKKLITRKQLFEVEEAPKLLKSTWDSWKWNELNEDKLKTEIKKLKDVVEEINEALNDSGRAIGHRVWQSIEGYVKNYPLVLSNLDNEEKLKKYIEIAFEDALVQKLIPKLRGLETSGDIRENCLEKIQDIIGKKAPGISKDFEIALNNPYGVFVWTSSSYLENEILE